jgi:hypothetical protein
MNQPSSYDRLERFLSRLRHVWRLISLASLLLLVGCANGDFGRVNPTLVTDDMHNWVGRDAPGRKNKPASQLALTDAEHQLRDLGYALIEPPYDRQRWYSVLAEYGLIGASEVPFPDRTAYATNLLTTPVRSHTARYAKLVEDVRNDVVRIDPFFAVARYVVDMDRKRNESMRQFGAASRETREDVRARVAENLAVIQWVQKSLRARVSSYQLALQRLAVESPSPMATEAERSITLMETRIASYQGILTPQVATVSPSFGRIEQGIGKD